jgi:hypothetical protein
MTPEDALDVLVAAIPRGYGFVSAIVKLNGKTEANLHSTSDRDDWWNDEVEEALTELAETAKRHLTRKPFAAQLEFENGSNDRDFTVYTTKITTDVWLVEVLDEVIRPPAEDNPVVRAVEAVMKDVAEDPK